MFSWALPNYSSGWSKINGTIIRPFLSRYLLHPLGIWQNWNMYVEYSPQWSEVTWTIVGVTHGQQTDLHYPMMQNLGYWDRYFHHRFRKFVEVAMTPGFLKSTLQPSACSYFAKKSRTEGQTYDYIWIVENLTTIRAPDFSRTTVNIPLFHCKGDS
jgi:hypothetical protein